MILALARSALAHLVPELSYAREMFRMATGDEAVRGALAIMRTRQGLQATAALLVRAPLRPAAGRGPTLHRRSS